MISLPTEFEEKMKRILGKEYEDFRESYELPRKFGLRVNRRKLSPGELERISGFHLTPIPWVDNGFYYEEEDRPSRHPFYYAGLYYLQEPSAMTPASVLPIEEGDRVLDLCAAPGGKATELGAKLLDHGFLAANDISGPRCRALLKNVEVFGIGNSLLLNEVPAKLAKNFPEFFDKILVDAPCSGEGMFRKDEDAAKAWYPEKPVECARMQREILSRAVSMLRPGGLLLYSTCTFSPEEDEQMAAWLLSRYPELSLEEVPWYEGFDRGRPYLTEPQWVPSALGEIPLSGEERQSLTRCVRIWPHRMGGEGHFLALFRKAGEKPERKQVPRQKNARLTREEAGVLKEFLKDVSRPFAMENIEARKGQVYYVPEESRDVKGLVFVRNGLYMGELKKGRFEPSQAMAVNLKKEEYRRTIDLKAGDGRVLRYLKGETIEISEEESGGGKGWYLFCTEGYPLGWGKLNQGTLKNKYLASWRMTM